MPSRHRLRYASTSSAPQALLNINNQNNLKAASSASSSSSSAAASSATTTNFSSSFTRGCTTGKNIKGHNHNGCTVLASSSSSSQHHYQNQNHPNYHFHHNQHQCHSSNGEGCSVELLSEVDEKQARLAHLLTFTKDQLKIECRKRGQKTNGNRFELLQRLGIKMSQIQKKVQQNTDNSPRNRKNNSNMDLNLKSSNQGSNSQKKSNGSPNGSPLQQQQQQQQFSLKKKSQKTNKEKEREEREQLVLHRNPIETIKYCSLEIVTLTQTYGRKLFQHRTLLVGFLLLAIILGTLYNIPGRHQIAIEIIRRNTWFFVYWVGLGILSSVGLGTGLHTFLLYLGPHIASVTLAAYECNALNFPKPPYPDDIICPEAPNLSEPPNLWNIMRKVRLEAFLWGAGTALGELPPYFMAKAARLSGYDPEDAEDIAAFEELKAKKGQKDLSFVDRGKLLMERVVEKIGFFGILACASIPNPLFDLAGITCGHFLVPFWTFFGATLIGKAIIKMHIQKVFVIIAFNEALIERAVDMLQIIPVFGKKLQEPFKGFLQNQKHRLHRKNNATATESGNLLSKVFEGFVICMVCYFVMSIVNSLAQNYHKRIHKKGKKVVKKVVRE